MSNNIVKKIGVIFLGISCIVLVCIVMANLAEQGSKGRSPIRTLIISFDATQKDEFFAQISRFSEKHSFKIYLRDVEVDIGPSGKGFFIEMSRSDIRITSIGVPNDPIRVSLYVDIPDSNSQLPSQETIDELYNDLKAFLLEIEGVEIIEE
jgi:hypothetical protein